MLPIGVGVLFGFALRLPRGARRSGLLWMLACIAVPIAAAALVYRRFTVVGLWDAGLETMLACVATVWTAHGRFAGRSPVALFIVSLVASLAVLELACRSLLPPPPVFGGAGSPHLLLADALRADPELRPADTQSKEIVCSVVYGDEYPGLIGLPPDSRLVLPRTHTPRAGAIRRVLHLGDSMVFGLGVTRAQTLTAALERLEPGVEHVNGGISGIAPDAYFAVLRTWLEKRRFDAVIMYLFEGNDVRDVDGPFPCCDWQPLLAYDGDHVSLRCRTSTAPDLGHATWTWLRYNSPPPYLFRAVIPGSAAAAYLSAAMVEPGIRSSLIFDQTEDVRLSHIEAILRQARAELSARGIEFVVVVLPQRSGIERGAAGPDDTDRHSQLYELLAPARPAGVRVLDAWAPLRRAVADGPQPFLGSPEQPDIHLNTDGHALMAKWLHEQLSAAAPVAR